MYRYPDEYIREIDNFIDNKLRQNWWYRNLG
jgi:hypothetical protein